MPRCECSDPGCRHNATRKEFQGYVCPATAVHKVHNISYDDKNEFDFCQDCTEDAVESGVFVIVG